MQKYQFECFKMQFEIETVANVIANTKSRVVEFVEFRIDGWFVFSGTTSTPNAMKINEWAKAIAGKYQTNDGIDG